MKSANHASPAAPREPAPSRRTRLIVCLSILLLAFGVRALSWHDTRLEVGKVQTAVAGDYRRIAQLMRQDGIRSFFSRASPLADPQNLGHPPGYSILLGLIQAGFGESNAAFQFVQITGDALSAVIIFLIVAELFSLSAAAMAGLLAAFSPQFAWNSVLLLPDSLSVLPILLAVYLLARALKNPRLVTFGMAGALIGISCWFRANAMFLPLFFAAAALLLVRSNRHDTSWARANRRRNAVPSRWRFALAVVVGALLVVLPLTIRNAIVFHRFIPISLGAGQTMLEGIADYDSQERFGIPRTDIGIMKQEAVQFQRPDYAASLFAPDGVERERARLSRGWGVIRSDPIWFAGVMLRRASSMVRLERSRLVSKDVPVSHSLSTDSLSPVWSTTAGELLASGIRLSPRVQVAHDQATDTLTLAADESTYGRQFSSNVVEVRKNVDYVFVLPVKAELGRMRISVVGANGDTYSSRVVETLEHTRPEDQPVVSMELPFVSGKTERVQVIFSNEAPIPASPRLSIWTIKLYELGPAGSLWTRYPRFVVHAVQKLFLTAVMLPLEIIGVILLGVGRRFKELLILSVVPIYYVCVQSALHTEYRYVLVIQYFLFGFLAVGVTWATQRLWSFAQRPSRVN